MIIASQGGASGVLYGHVRGGQGFANPAENGAAVEAAAKVAARVEAAAPVRRVDEPKAPPGARDQADRAAYRAPEESTAAARRVQSSAASATTVIQAAIEEQRAAAPSMMQEILQAHRGDGRPLSEQPAFEVGPDRGQLGGSGPREFNGSLAKDGVASLDEVWVSSRWSEARVVIDPDRGFGADPIGYDGARLVQAAQDRHAPAQAATFA